MAAAAPAPDPDATPWPLYASAVIELAVGDEHLVLTPLPDPAADDGGELGPVLGPVLGSVPVWVLTAGDPYPVTLPSEENAARNAVLRQRLDALELTHAPALGRSPDGATSEASVAVAGAEQQVVLDLAAEFGQLAVYAIDHHIACIDVASARTVTVRPYRLARAPRASGSLVGPTGWTG